MIPQNVVNFFSDFKMFCFKISVVPLKSGYRVFLAMGYFVISKNEFCSLSKRKITGPYINIVTIYANN